MSPLTWSPPSSPDPHDAPVIATDHRGMTTDPTQSPSPSKKNAVKPAKPKRRTLQYVSRHFTPIPTQVRETRGQKKGKRNTTEDEGDRFELVDTSQAIFGDEITASAKQTNRASKRSRRINRKDVATIEAQEQERKAENNTDVKRPVDSNHVDRISVSDSDTKLSKSKPQRQSRIVLGIDIDELSSDSDLTDVPEDIGPDPFLTRSQKKRRKVKKEQNNVELVAVKEHKTKAKPKKTSLTKSPYFPHPHKSRPTFLSTLPFPPLDNPRFGLMQERLHRDPFRLLLATIFLNKTPGARAMPIFFQLMERYPTPQDLAKAQQPDVTEIIRELGFQNQRARKCIAMAERWVQDPPVKDRRWRKLGYPTKGDGKNVKEGEIIDDVDERVAWEISHLPGLGPYSHDSWRMFCRDQLRGLSTGYDGENAGEGFEPEWKRVLPMDKELRAWMTWMWMKEGWVWNKETGQRTKASDELMDLARGKGNVVLESENNTLMVKSLDEDQSTLARLDDKMKSDVRVEAPAGDFLPEPLKE